MLALKISHEGLDSVKREIDCHYFHHLISHKPADGGCMNGLTNGTCYSPFVTQCQKLQKDDSPLSKAIYNHIETKEKFDSKNELYTRHIGRFAGNNTVDHCTYYSKENDSSVSVHTYFFDKAALITLLESFSK